MKRARRRKRGGTKKVQARGRTETGSRAGTREREKGGGKEFPQDTTQQMSRRMQINPTTRRSKLCTYARMRQSLFQALRCMRRCWGDVRVVVVPPTPTHSPRMPPQGTSLQRCNGAMRPTLQPSVHYRIRRVRRDPGNRLLCARSLRGIALRRRCSYTTRSRNLWCGPPRGWRIPALKRRDTYDGLLKIAGLPPSLSLARARTMSSLRVVHAVPRANFWKIAP